MLLGEAQSKIEHLAGIPLRPDIAETLHHVYLAKGVLATTAIEGNTLTEDEARKLVDNRLELSQSREYLGQELQNIIEAINVIFRDIVDEKTRNLSFDAVLEFNRIVLDRLPEKEGVIPGEIRNYDVSVGQYHGAPPSDCEYLTRKLCDWIGAISRDVPRGFEIAFEIIKAVIAHVYMAWIHPFGDGNGRTARLIEFRILVSAGVPSVAAHLLSNHYNLTRSEYYRQLSLSSSSPNGILSFIHYALRGFVDSLKEEISTVRDYQIDITWRNFVHESLGHDSPSTNRKRHLVLDLSAHEEGIPLSEITDVSIRVHDAYAKIGDRTLTRDINELIKQGFLVKAGKNIKANKDSILAFLPARRAVSESPIARD
jgi:Fic family protein